ncbi:RHS repeat-associated core domain protein [Saprospira grandis DSM 2844]|uniref:RHS repeat-associated core domain protein n=1 Tax=Saprospira grandis DSM 2844 TaxID=694433 RepID=J0PB38_9BACT|nr:RHS repeat-associated core domain-containing protein [Saprospira grandis]EJF54867.1 RHS repeat-associated core domain protein [Saprospira grandis DSM 2844]
MGQDSSQTGQADYYLAQVSSANLYYPFGWEMPGRKFVSGEGYRFGFNGKEDDRDWGTQNIQDYGFRLYNPSIGKFLSVDPLAPDYPWYTPYQFAGNKPIVFIDLDGLEPATPRTLQTPALDNARVIIPSIYLKDQHVATHSQMEEHNAMYENLPPMDEPSTEGVHAVLDGLGLIPGFGEPADGLNGLIYTIEGRPVDASLSCAAMVPILGWTATASKWTKNTVKYANKVGGKSHDLVKESARAIKPKNQKSAGEIITITKVGSRLDALKVVEGQVGDLGKGAKPKMGKLVGQKDRVTGMQSADESRGWRIDYDPEKGAHYNWWTEKEKGAVPFEGTERQVDQLIESLTNTYK